MRRVIRVNYLTYFFAISAILTGMFKEFLVLLVILTTHEIGHIITIKYFNYDIKKIEILPFGGLIKIQKDINSSINKEMLISISGIFMQLILFIVISFLCQKRVVSIETYYIFKKYNLSILIFNLLPIYPLDGSIFLRCLLEKIFSFRMSNVLIIVISIINIVVYLYINYLYNLNNYIIAVFLVYKIIDYIRNYKYLENRFLIERYINNYKFSKIKRIRSIGDISKEKLSYKIVNNRLVKERKIIENFFFHRV